MYRDDRYLEIADLKLRLFVEYCRELPILFDDISICKDQIYKCKTASIIKIQPKTAQDKLLDILEKKDLLIEQYRQRIVFIKPICDILKTLQPNEIKLLKYRYEDKMTLRDIGKICNYSYMSISRMLDEVLLKFCD